MSAPTVFVHPDWTRPTRPHKPRPAWRPAHIPPWPPPAPDPDRLVPDDTIEAIERDYAAYWRQWALERAELARRNHQSPTSQEKPP